MVQDYKPKTVIGNYNKTKEDGLNTYIDTVKYILDNYSIDCLTVFTNIDSQYLTSLKRGLLPIEAMSLRTYNELMAVYLTHEPDIKKEGEDKNTVTDHKPMTMMEATLKGKNDNDEPTGINESINRAKEFYDESVMEAQKELFKTDMLLQDMQSADLRRIICFNNWIDEVDEDMWHNRERLILFLYHKLEERTKEIYLKKRGVVDNASHEHNSKDKQKFFFNGKEFTNLEDMLEAIFC